MIHTPNRDVGVQRVATSTDWEVRPVCESRLSGFLNSMLPTYDCKPTKASLPERSTAVSAGKAQSDEGRSRSVYPGHQLEQFNIQY